MLALLTACASPQRAVPTATPFPPSVTSTKTSTNKPEPTSIPIYTPSATAIFLPSPTVILTFSVLRGEVLERANCRYGPGVSYLYKYGLVKGSNLEVIGRLDDASWLQIRAIGGNNPCWVKASLMEVTGDVFSIEPVYPDKAPLPASPYYVPLTLIDVTREGEQITIRWYGQSLRAGDEEYEYAPLYLAEIWACENGEIKFTSYGLHKEDLTIIDENGCGEASHGRVYFSEKHGYAGPTEIEFPK